MQYTISYKEPHKRFIDIDVLIENIDSEKTYLQLPAWRPGRYELQNFARNIQRFSVTDQRGNPVSFKKISKEQWEVNTKDTQSLKVSYNCYAYQMDAGGCWLDEEQVYINFIYCLIYVIGQENKVCTVKLDIPENYKIACGLPQKGHTLFADDFYHLADSPMIASASVQHRTYTAAGVDFHIWIQGDAEIGWDQILPDFKKFSEEQIRSMGSFPEKDYHFLYQFLPHKQHHGVEHRNSTIITIGPAELIKFGSLYTDFISVSSHELFHAWNIIKIRPKEMMPYDLTKENYFQSGFIVEGVTTYYGEYFLARTGVFSQEQYFAELNSMFKKHFENYGNYHLSVADSSFDLWIDGYVPGIPNRKVSIYVKGAVIALILDLEIRKSTGNAKCLDDVMRVMWNEFGKKQKGYTIKDYQTIAEEIAGRSFQDYFDECVFGLGSLNERLDTALRYIGCELNISDTKTNCERTFGFKTVLKEGKLLIDVTRPGSPSDKYLSREDEVIAIDGLRVNGSFNEMIGNKQKIAVTYFRKNKLNNVVLEADQHTYFRQFRIAKRKDASEAEKTNYKVWLKADF